MNETPSTAAADRLLTESEAAERLAVSVRTLQQWRVSGGGPLFVKLGRAVRYRPSELTIFVGAGTRFHTSEGVR